MRTSGWRIIVKKITQFEENVSSTVMIFFHIILHPAVLIYDFIYIHNFIIILSRVYNEPIQRPAQRWLVSLILVERSTAIAEGQGFESRTSLNFFRLFFHNCKSYIIFLVIYIAIFLKKFILSYTCIYHGGANLTSKGYLTKLYTRMLCPKV